MSDPKPYKVGNGYYCDLVGEYATFEEALAHYQRIPHPKRNEPPRVKGIWNAELLDYDTDGLTEEEREQVGEYI